ncbi:MAG: rpoA [Dehalococcoidales bacterium]|nr:rpoA [Dehalococcoidales bacterium]
MSHLVVAKIQCVESRDNFGRFVIEPLEKGFGVTLGNALRRVLLAHLQGAAVTRIKIEGTQHEFSTIPHVKEDVIELLLNIKAIRIKPVAGRPGKLILDVTGEGPITAADIKPSVEFEIANPGLYLATLDSPEAKLYAELDVELATGYKEAESSTNLPIGVIPVDAIFTPARQVNYTVEPIHVGQETSRERLNLEIWTDSTVSPADAVSRSAEILKEQLSPFALYSGVSPVEEKVASRLPIPEEKFNMPMEELNLSARTLNCLRRGGIGTVGEVITKGEKELLNLRNFGQRSLEELEERLNGLGLSLHPEGKEGEAEKPIEPEEVPIGQQAAGETGDTP